jgi:hypothetical protein
MLSNSHSKYKDTVPYQLCQFDYLVSSVDQDGYLSSQSIRPLKSGIGQQVGFIQVVLTWCLSRICH